MAVRSITDYGAVSGADNNTAAVQAAHDAASAGDDLHIPSGGYLMRRTPSPWSARITKRVNITGPGTLIMHPEDAQNAPDPNDDANSLLYFTTTASGSTIRGVFLEGSKLFPNTATAYDPVLEHHRAMFFDGTCDVVVEDTDIRNFYGDAAQLYNNCQRYAFRRCLFEWQQRDNITLAPFGTLTPVRDVLIEHCTLRGAPGQQVDNEHGAAHDVIVRHCTIDAAPFSLVSGLGVAIAGSGADVNGPSTNWDIYNNTIYGGVRFTWCSYSKLRNNTIINALPLPGVELQRGQTDNHVFYNTIVCTQSIEDNHSGIYVSGTIGGGASNIFLYKNKITMTGRDKVFGIRFAGVESADVYDNDIIGPGLVAAGYSGIRMRATVTDRPVLRFYCARNKVRNFGNRGIDLANSTTAQIVYAEIRDNVLFNDTGITSQSVGMDLGDESFVQTALVTGNKLGPGVVTDITNTLVGSTYTINASGVASARDMARNVMANIDIGGVIFPVYGTLDSDDPGPPDPDGVLSADSYMLGRFDAATTWAAATADNRKRALVTAQRYLDTLKWKGTKTSPTQPLAWPRTGVTLSDGTVVSSILYPTAIVYAEYDLAYALIVNPALLTDTTTGGPGNVKRVKAGSAEVEFFKGTSLLLLPQNILVSIQDYLASTGLATSAAIVTGTGEASIFDPFRAYDINGTLE